MVTTGSPLAVIFIISPLTVTASVLISSSERTLGGVRFLDGRLFASSLAAYPNLSWRRPAVEAAAATKTAITTTDQFVSWAYSFAKG